MMLNFKICLLLHLSNNSYFIWDFKRYISALLNTLYNIWHHNIFKVALVKAVIMSYFTLSSRNVYSVKTYQHLIDSVLEKKALFNVHYHCNKEDSSIFGAVKLWYDDIFCAWNLTLWNASSPLAWAQRRCGLSGSRSVSTVSWLSFLVQVCSGDQAVPDWTTPGPSWAQLS